MSLINRSRALSLVERALRENPVCALIGPRQCGKTTLAGKVMAGRERVHLFDLESEIGRSRLARGELALTGLRGLVVIDEIQRQPSIFETLRVLADRRGSPARFLVLGSAAPELMRGVSETLAGRVGFVELGPFHAEEVGTAAWRRLWLRGGFPRSFTARADPGSMRWRRDFIRTFLERDLSQLGIRVAPETLRRFWMMVAHFHGQIWNGAELARSLGVSEHTARSYLDILCGSYVARQLPPWFVNIGKRQVRSPKVYVRDSGLLHALLQLRDIGDLEAHPKFGASWEGFALEQVLATTGSDDAYFWGTHAGAELDLLLIRHGRRYGVEFKAAAAPAMTRSLHIAREDLTLGHA